MRALPADAMRLALFAAGGCALGALVWLWLSQGANVYFAYLTGAFLACL
jgi:hypothetical protein